MATENNKKVIAKVSKAGPNLFVKVPVGDYNKIGRGDKVMLVVIEKAVNIEDKKSLKQEIMEFLDNPGASKLSGQVCGYNIDIPIKQMMEMLPKDKVEKLFHECLLNK